jgi:ligand-binding sensor domain-containing protein
MRFYIILFFSCLFFCCNYVKVHESNVVVAGVPSIVNACPVMVMEINKPKEVTIENVEDNFKNTLSDENIMHPTCFGMEFIDKKNRLWFYSHNLYCYDNKVLKKYSFTQTYWNDTSFTALTGDTNGNIWLGTNLGYLIRLDSNLATIYSLNNDSLDFKCNFSIRCFYTDKSGKIWIGTNHGITCFDLKTYTSYNVAQGLRSNCIDGFMPDTANILWLSTTDGICRFDGKTFSFLNRNEGLFPRLIYGMEEDKNGNFLLGTDYGIWQYDGKTFINEYLKVGIPKPTRISCIYRDRDKNIWFNTPHGICQFDGINFTNFNPQILQTNEVRSIAQDSTGDLWFGMCFGELLKYHAGKFTTLRVL